MDFSKATDVERFRRYEREVRRMSLQRSKIYGKRWYLWTIGDIFHSVAKEFGLSRRGLSCR